MEYLSLPRWITALWLRYRLVALLLINAVLLLALASTIWIDNALNRGIDYTPDPTPIPWTDGPLVGVNLYNLQAEPDPAVVTRTLQLVRDMGVRYVRMQLPWEDIEIHGRGDFTDRRNVDSVGVVSSWAKYDRIVDTAHQLGLELVLRIDRPPDWAREVNRSTPFFQEGLLDDPTSTGPPDDFEQYGRFVFMVAHRYRDRVRFFQIWNEPNLKTEWNWHTPDPESFVVLLRIGYRAVKRANPDAVVIFPSLSPSDGLDRRAPITELEYLDQIYQYGGGAYFDIMSAQAYGLGQPPDEYRYVRLRPFDKWWWRRPLDTRTDVSRIVLIREVMERNGDSHKPIWVGEFGWNSAPDTIPAERRYTWGEPVSEHQKADYIIGQIERARREWPWIGVMHVWNLRHGGYNEPDPADPTPYFSLVQRDWTPLPAYTRLQHYLAQPAVAGLGAHTWQHPAVEPIPNGWRLRFSGQRITLYGGLAEQMQVTLDGRASSLERGQVDSQTGQPSAFTLPATLADGVHVLEIVAPGAEPPVHFVVARDPPLPLWIWAALPAVLIGLLLVSGTATMQELFSLTHRVWLRSPPARLGVRVWLATAGGERALLLGMLAGLLVFYGVTNDLPTRLIGVVWFGILACIRPDLALLYVPLTVPLFFMPKGIWDDRFGLSGDGIRVPLHEMVLLVAAGAALLRWPIDHYHLLPRRLLPGMRAYLGSRKWWLRLAPAALFFLAGTIGVLIVPPEGRGNALREWRWLIFEPLLFYALLHYHGRSSAGRSTATASLFQQRVVMFFLAGGAFVGLLALLQFVGVNLVPYVGDKVSFSADQMAVEGVRRVTSVYGHPNNLGLAMGRIWPLALALLLAALRRQAPLTRLWYAPAGALAALFFAVCCLLTGGGLLVSFSKGAFLGAAGALVVFAFLRRESIAARAGLSRFWWALSGLLAVGGGLGVVALVAADIGIERLNPLGESTSIRLKLWGSSLALLRDHPLLGIGLDQFLSYYQTGYIHPSLVGTNEQFTSHPHTMLLDIWLRLGLLGIVAVGWLLGRFYRSILRQHRPSLLHCGLAAAMSAALIHGMVDNFYFVPDLAIVFWLLLWTNEHEEV